jgi:sulfotransferase family protein
MTDSPESFVPGVVAARRLPDFFIVGHHKSGTTALYEMLRRHPQIYMPELKEPRYFAADLRALVPSPPTYPQTLEQYLALFAAAAPEQRAGEASPSYLRSQTAAGAIAAVQPAARIVAIFREPASFVGSMHLQLLREHVETEPDLARAVANEELERQGQPVRRYADHVRYAEQLRRYHAVFAPEQVLALIYDDFRADNEATVRRVLRFLDVDDRAPIEVLEANPTVRVRSLRVDAAVRRLYVGRGPLAGAAKRTARALLPESLRRGALGAIRRRLVYGRPRAPDEQLVRELKRRYRSEVLALGEYLDRDLLTLWGYEDIP